MTEQTPQYVPSDIAETHVTLGNAGAGPELDLEHVYPPNKWGHQPEMPPKHKMAGPPYTVANPYYWPEKVDAELQRLEGRIDFQNTNFNDLIDRRLAMSREIGLLESRVAHIEALVHKSINLADETPVLQANEDMRHELNRAYDLMHRIWEKAQEVQNADNVDVCELFDLIDAINVLHGQKWSNGL